MVAHLVEQLLQAVSSTYQGKSWYIDSAYEQLGVFKSPEDYAAHLSLRSIVTSDQMLSAIPRQSKPGPILALVAGTRTTTRLRSIAASLKHPITITVEKKNKSDIRLR